MLVHDIIKIKYVQLGYIQKNYPYHLISDEEMFNAFIDLGTGFTSNLIDPDSRFFDMNYPNPFAVADGEIPDESPEESDEYYDAYGDLREYIISSINAYLKYYGTAEESEHQIPDWVYTYMLGEVIYEQSDYLDKEDMLKLLGHSNIDNIFTPAACVACYKTSLNYISTLTTGIRPPTVFGEPHVIKQLRMES